MNHIILSNCCSSHTLHPSIHIAALGSNAISRPWPLMTCPPPSCIVFVLIPPSTAHKLPYSAPGLPLPKPTAITQHSNRIKWQIVVLGRDRQYPKQHTQHGDKSSSHSAVDKESSILAYDALSINCRRFGDLAVSIFRSMPSPWATTLKMETTKVN